MSRRRVPRRALGMLLASAAATGGPTVAGALSTALVPTAPDAVPVQLLVVNDFHGRITQTVKGESRLTSPGRDGAVGTADDVVTLVGGSAHMAATFERLREEFWREPSGAFAASFTVGAGDLVGDSPFESAFYRDEPTVEVLNALDMDVSTVGNHEFDRGTHELRRISAATDGSFTDDVTACQGVTPGVDGCFGTDAHAFTGTQFPFLAANVVDSVTGDPILPPYTVLRTPDGQGVGVIGVTTVTTPGAVPPDGVSDVRFLDEADAVNRWAAHLRSEGVEAIVVLAHEGGDVADPLAGDANGCNGLEGPILDINRYVDPAVDLIVSAHTHGAYNCMLPVLGGDPRLVTQGGHYGRMVTDIRLTLDRRTGDVDRTATYAANNVPVTREAVDPAVDEIASYWRQRADRDGAVPIARLTDDIDRGFRDGDPVRDVESALGNLMADAMLAGARSVPGVGGADVAFLHPGRISADLDCAGGDISRAEAYAVFQVGGTVDAQNLTGAGIERVLEQQWAPRRGGDSFVQLSVSSNVRYEFDPGAPVGERVDPRKVLIDGVPLDLDRVYRVVGNSSLILGGDEFTAFREERPQIFDRVTGPKAADALTDYLAAQPGPIAPPALDRAVSTDPAQPYDDDGSGDDSPARC